MSTRRSIGSCLMVGNAQRCRTGCSLTTREDAPRIASLVGWTLLLPRTNTTRLQPLSSLLSYGDFPRLSSPLVTTTTRLLTSPASLSATRTIIAIEMTAASPIALLTQQAWEHSLSASQVSPSVLHLSLDLLLTTTSALAVGDARPLARRSARHRDGLSPPGRDHWSVIRPFLSPNDQTEI